ncbi:hypothetical protein FF100_05040 [Methylobacterium terricola]|uniref:Uncharacterized protein n=1 Tax=Methylobacterium terricola TaxID=2583531 RepID=A0A5C4LQ17_9HYPH|nr:hypothetical protein [Methylobacterium terricola]TNC14942.1 hypothetical protein FF100_05040 [Methylobacterium terricola]
MTHPPTDPQPSPIVWRHTWPERGPDFVASIAGGRIGRIHKTHPDAIAHREWVWSLAYRPRSRIPMQGRVHTKQEAADAIRASLGIEMQWLAKQSQPLSLRPADPGPDPRLDWMRPPVRIIIGRDVPWPEGWGKNA